MQGGCVVGLICAALLLAFEQLRVSASGVSVQGLG